MTSSSWVQFGVVGKTLSVSKYEERDAVMIHDGYHDYKHEGVILCLYTRKSTINTETDK